MLTIDNTETYGWEHAIRGMRNPMNSWDKSDSIFGRNPAIPYAQNNPSLYVDEYGITRYIGDNDLDLMKRLSKAGTDHRKYLRMITVYCDITAPLYWWKEFDTYKVGTVANSCSTMHKIQDKKFTLDDFSHEHLIETFKNDCEVGVWWGTDADNTIAPKDVLEITICSLNTCREAYLETGYKEYWWQMIQLLPSSYNQKRTIMLNYEVLANIYKSRKNHKLDEWHTFCDWIELLPYSELIIGEE